MNANFERMTIEMTKAEAKEAGKYNSDKYNELMAIRSQFPTFRIVTKNTPKKRDNFKGLTYAYMEKYIDRYAENHKEEKERVQQIRNEFDTLRGFVDGKKNDFVDAASYGEVKEWFLLQFPEIEKYNQNVEDLKKKTKKAIEAKKSA